MGGVIMCNPQFTVILYWLCEEEESELLSVVYPIYGTINDICLFPPMPARFLMFSNQNENVIVSVTL